MPYPNEHAARVKTPAGFVRVRDITAAMKKRGWKVPAGIRILGGPTKGAEFKVQSWRFDKSEWTPARAQKWLKANDHAILAFEEARE